MPGFDDQIDGMLEDALAIVGESCAYTPVTGDPFDIIVIAAGRDEEIGFSDSRIRPDGGGVFEIRKSVLAQPVKGDRISYRGRDWVVKSFSTPDDERLLWVLDCAPV